MNRLFLATLFSLAACGGGEQPVQPEPERRRDRACHAARLARPTARRRQNTMLLMQNFGPVAGKK